MQRDPLYRAILQALEEKRFDPNEFEACACDLLRDVFPSLVPIRGGNDAGMDGAIADGEAEAFPLVATTAQNVNRNLSSSLDSYVRQGGRRRKAVLASSQSLTPQGRRKLEQSAREKEFVLVQVFEQRAMADRLYGSPKWRQDLLGIPGSPSAFSPLPRSRRRLLEIDLVGRDTDVEWLRSTSGDRLLTGPPGSGKTFLVYHLVRDGWGSFLTSGDEEAIADAWREQRPEVVIVDDAQDHLERIGLLRHLRESLGFEYSILAISWVRDRDQVLEALGDISTSQIRRLELLTRLQTLEVIRQVGVLGSDRLLSLLADQAANKPGLAAMLAWLCLQGDVQKVVTGEALYQAVVPTLERLVGERATIFLGALGLGGERGMSLSAFEEIWRWTPDEPRRLARDLEAGGVLSEAGGSALSVQPRDLRWALVKRTFFTGSPMDLDYRPWLERAPSRTSAVLAILGARHCGARVSRDELRQLVRQLRPQEEQGFLGREEQGAIDAWRLYAALGEEEGRWALENFPGTGTDIAEEALNGAPREAILRLLSLAVHAEEPLHLQPSHPLHILEGWLRDLDVRSSALLERRKLVIQAVKEHLDSGGDRGVGIRALFLALSPKLASNREAPEHDGRIKLRQGLLPVEQLHGLADLWEEVRPAITEIDQEMRSRLERFLWEWSYPEPCSADQKRVTHELAAKVLKDLVPLARGSAGLTASLTRQARRIGLSLPLEVDPVFDLLFPDADFSPEEWEQREAREREALERMAKDWAAEKRPEEAASLLTGFERQADLGGHTRQHPGIPLFCHFLARQVRSVAGWVNAFLDEELRGDLLQPFLQRLGEQKSSGWEELFQRALRKERSRGAAIAEIVKLEGVPEELLREMMSWAGAFSQFIETMALRDEVPATTARFLLRAEDRNIAVSTAIGLWLARKSPPGPFLEDWRSAVLRTADTDDNAGRGRSGYWLGEILKRDSRLACSWLERYLSIGRNRPALIHVDKVVRQAVGALEEEDRLQLLRRFQSPEAQWLLQDALKSREGSLLIDDG